jgi:hypothetical protein
MTTGRINQIAIHVSWTSSEKENPKIHSRRLASFLRKSLALPEMVCFAITGLRESGETLPRHVPMTQANL